MTSILVTGGAGYIRSHTRKVLRRAGFDPIAYDNLTRGNREAVRWGPLEVGELADRGHVRETLTSGASACGRGRYSSPRERAKVAALLSDYCERELGSTAVGMVACGSNRSAS